MDEKITMNDRLDFTVRLNFWEAIYLHEIISRVRDEYLELKKDDELLHENTVNHENNIDLCDYILWNIEKFMADCKIKSCTED